MFFFFFFKQKTAYEIMPSLVGSEMCIRDRYILRLLRFDELTHPIDLSGWERLVDRVEAATRPVRIGIIGKYIDLPDAYLSVVEALRHAGFHHGAKVEINWIQAANVPDLLHNDGLRDFDGLVIPGGFGA